MATILIILFNSLFFVYMLLHGVDFINPSAQSIYNFGGNVGPNIWVKGEYWRLLASNYIHIGFIHLLFNMWCLHVIGSELEYLIGSRVFIGIYSISGLSGSVASSFINYDIVGAGASGAIFGLAGTLLSIRYLYNQSLENHDYRYDNSAILFFILFNTVYGFSIEGIDNSAHLGGLFSGLILGYLLHINDYTKG